MGGDPGRRCVSSARQGWPVCRFRETLHGQIGGVSPVKVTSSGKHARVHIDRNGGNHTGMVVQVMNTARLGAGDFLF